MRNLKKFLALVLALMMAVSVMATVSAADYTDEASIDASYSEAIDVMTAIGVFQGRGEAGNSAFDPTGNLNRAEAAKIFSYMLLGSGAEDLPVEEVFSDVPTTYWGNKFVNYASLKEIVDSANDAFRPTDTITGYEFGKMALVAAGFDPAEYTNNSLWKINVIEDVKGMAATTGYSLKEGALSSAPITREAAAQLAFSAINYTETPKATGTYEVKVLTGNWQNQDNAAELAAGVEGQVFASQSEAIIYVETLYKSMGGKVVLKPGTHYEIVPVMDNSGSIARNVYNLKKGNLAPDSFGRPGYSWTQGNQPVVTIGLTPAAESEVVISECELVDALGTDEDTPVADVWVNGQQYSGAAAEKFLGNNNGAAAVLKATATTPLVGAQGRLTQVFYYGGEYHVVMLDQFLAQVTKVVDRTFDDAGHIKTAATIQIQAYDGVNGDNDKSKLIEDSSYFADYPWSVGQYVLIYGKTEQNSSGELLYQGKPVIEIIDAAPMAATGPRTAYNSVIGTSTVAGNTYSWAKQYHLGNPGADFTTFYNVYTDTYGNLIGLVEPPAAALNYALLDKGAQITATMNPYFAAQLIGFDGAIITGAPVTVDKYDNEKVGTSFWTDQGPTPVNHIVTYLETEAGYVLKDAADGSVQTNAQIYQGTPKILLNGSAKAVTDNETVYLVEAPEGVFATYTGYQSVPSMTGLTVEYVLGQDHYADLVYVDATHGSLVTQGTQALAYITNQVNDETTGGGMLEDGTTFKMVSGVVLDGTTSVVYMNDTVEVEDTMKGQLVTLTYDKNNLVEKIDLVKPVTTDTISHAHHEDVVYFTTTGDADDPYTIDGNTLIWVVSAATGDARVGTADDFDAVGASVQFTTLKANPTMLEYVVITVA